MFNKNIVYVINLLPELRPYQRRVVFWTVQREKGALRHLQGSQQFVSPLCVLVGLVDSCSKIYYNSFSGSVSASPENCSLLAVFLLVLVGKTKVEAEDALRKLVVALNGLVGISIIKQDFPQAIFLYKEALELAEEHSEDFRVDPLLNIHLHINLAEILPLTNKSQQYAQYSDSGSCDGNICKMCNGSNNEKKIVCKPCSVLSRCTSYQSLLTNLYRCHVTI